MNLKVLPQLHLESEILTRTPEQSEGVRRLGQQRSISVVITGALPVLAVGSVSALVELAKSTIVCFWVDEFYEGTKCGIIQSMCGKTCLVL